MPKNVQGFKLLPGLHKAMKPKKILLMGGGIVHFQTQKQILLNYRKKKHIIIFLLTQIKHGI